MPMPKVYKKKEKVVAVSAKTGKKLVKAKTTPQEYYAMQQKKNKEENEKKAKLKAKMEADEAARKAAAVKEYAELNKTVDLITGEETPKIIAHCLARTLNLKLGMTPKQVLAMAAETMEVKLPSAEADKPAAVKSKLMVLVKVLAEGKTATKEKAKENKQRKAAEREAQQTALRRQREEEAAAREEEAKEAAAKVAAKLAEARAALEAKLAAMTPEELAAYHAERDAASKKADKDALRAKALQEKRRGCVVRARAGASLCGDRAEWQGQVDAAALCRGAARGGAAA